MPRADLAVLTSVVLLAACGGSDGTDPTPQPDPVVVTVTPSRDTLTVGMNAIFAAAVSGTTDPSASWRVQEGSGGTITAAGAYTAAATPGTFHVIASSVAEPSSSDTAAIQVVAAPNATITAPTDVGTGIAGQSASIPLQAGAIYQWSIAGGTITSTTTGPTVTFTGGPVGPLTLQCNVTNLAGTSATGSKVVAVQAIPQIMSFSASRNPVTNGQTVALTGVFSGGTGAVNQGVGMVNSGVPVAAGPVTGEMTYRLTVSGTYGPPAVADVTLRGVIPPSIYRFNSLQRVVATGAPANLQVILSRGWTTYRRQSSRDPGRFRPTRSS